MGGLVSYSVFEATLPRGHCVLSRLTEISLAPVIVIVMVPLSWARAGKEKIKTSIMATRILVIAVFIYPSEFDKPPPTVMGQRPWDKVVKVECYQPSSGFVKTLPLQRLLWHCHAWQ